MGRSFAGTKTGGPRKPGNCRCENRYRNPQPRRRSPAIVLFSMEVDLWKRSAKPLTDFFTNGRVEQLWLAWNSRSYLENLPDNIRSSGPAFLEYFDSRPPRRYDLLVLLRQEGIFPPSLELYPLIEETKKFTLPPFNPAQVVPEISPSNIPEVLIVSCLPSVLQILSRNQIVNEAPQMWLLTQ